MPNTLRIPKPAQVLRCWNWKCALMSATARSCIYLAAMTHKGPATSLAPVLVEMLYVTLTAGVYAGAQQRALGLASRWTGNLLAAFAIPAMSLYLDWLVHRAAGAPAPSRCMVATCTFALISALFHVYAMRSGAFLSGHGRSLGDDFRRVPRLIAGFLAAPVVLLIALAGRTVAPAPESAG